MDSLPLALDELRIALGPQRVLTAIDRIQKYKYDTSGTQREIPAAVLPRCTDDIIKIIKIASTYSLALYPISKGNNWGYGTSNPVLNGSVIVDLSEMNKITHFDANLGIVTIEPGVTQQMLCDFLHENGNKYLTPTTGAGPHGSIMGNALERGYGLTPVTDHFLAIQNIEAVLPNATIYHSPLYENGCESVDRVFKWGFGPYLDGIFSQGNFGIVTKMTIQLAARPEKIGAFVFEMKSEADLEKAVVIIQETLRELGGVAGSINLMNSLRLLSMSAPYPLEQIQSAPNDFIPMLKKMAHDMNFATWTCLGSFYGKKEIVATATQLLKERIYPHTKRLIFMSRIQLNILEKILSVLPRSISASPLNRIQKMKMTFDILEGTPSQVAMPLCYRKLPNGLPKTTDLNPARDGCGLFWYAPLVPMIPATVRQYVEFVHTVCAKHLIEPLITLTSVSDRCFDSTVPIIFDPQNAEDTLRAKNCFNELLKEGIALGFHPYRTGVDHMQEIIKSDQPFWIMQKAIKQAIDPKNIIAPGRYSAI
ncbi:MAG: FAD-binding oxidoreductase [Candidatus Omnitrophica bacterium]|nr:FAD-binding oxidoreductase [Candidatus Omnitrophota bacterium]